MGMQNYRMVARIFMVFIAAAVMIGILLNLPMPVHPAVAPAMPAEPTGIPAVSPSIQARERTTFNVSGSTVVSGTENGEEPGVIHGITPPETPFNPIPPVPEFSSPSLPIALLAVFIGIVLVIRAINLI
jgi:hypothetical protein